MRVPKRWRLLPMDTAQVDQLATSLKIAQPLAQLLVNRGVKSRDEAKIFLAPSLSGLHDPETLPGVSEAADRLYAAVKAGKRICIYGDYDVDGITASTILWRCLMHMQAKVEYYVPDRMEEGYGLNSEALTTLKENGVDVVVTVDCGIASIKEAEHAKQIGLELIVTDHHEMKETLPPASVLVHPRLPNSSYPFPHLCGAGVAFKLAWALAQKFSQAKKVSDQFRNYLLESVALVALGTVADVVPLVGENRIFVKHGLKSLQAAPTIGLKALLEASELQGKQLDAEHIGFTLAPRLNAAGRLGHARLAIELLGTDNAIRAGDLARYLNHQNAARQAAERKMLTEAREQAESMANFDKQPAFVLASADWHPGVIGIVASRLVDRYARPVLMIASKNEIAPGSGRSIDGFALHSALVACGKHLISHGGHAGAAGFKVKSENIDAFREAFCEVAAERTQGRVMQHTITLDAEVPLAALTPGLIKGIAALHPYGMGNRQPIFLSSGLQIVGEPRKVGQGERHVQFRVKQEQGPVTKAIAFGMAERLEELMSQSGRCCLAFTPKLNTWNDMFSVDMEVQDFQPGERAKLD